MKDYAWIDNDGVRRNSQVPDEAVPLVIMWTCPVHDIHKIVAIDFEKGTYRCTGKNGTVDHDLPSTVVTVDGHGLHVRHREPPA